MELGLKYKVYAKFHQNLIVGAVLDFETCRGTYSSVETNYQRDGHAQLAVNYLFSCRFYKQRTTTKLLSVACTCNSQLKKLIYWLSL